jgi:hypothetical protein
VILLTLVGLVACFGCGRFFGIAWLFCCRRFRDTSPVQRTPAIFAAIFAKIAFVTANGSALWLVWLAFGLSGVGCGEESKQAYFFDGDKTVRPFCFISRECKHFSHTL